MASWREARDRIADRLNDARGGPVYERHMQAIVGEEVRPIIVTDPAEASKLGYQGNAVDALLYSNDESWTRALSGDTVTGEDPTVWEGIAGVDTTTGESVSLPPLYDIPEMGEVFTLRGPVTGETTEVMITSVSDARHPTVTWELQTGSIILANLYDNGVLEDYEVYEEK